MKKKVTMKKIKYIVLGIVALTACNDGDISVQSMNFSNSDIQNCNGLYFKINGKELLVADFNKGDFSDQLDINAPLNEEQSFQITSSHPIIYRVYSDKVTSNVICSAIPPSEPIVNSEYISIPGATVIYKKNMITSWANSSANIKYFFDINFNHLTLTKGEEQIKYENYSFGTYTFETRNMTFNFTNPVVNCDNSTLFQNVDAELSFNISEDLKSIQTVGVFNYALSQDNYMLYTKYSGNIVEQAPCESKTNDVLEEWKATDGTLIVEVVNENNSLKKTYKLKNTRFFKGEKSFLIDDVILKVEIL